MLWLWRRPAAVALIGPLAWEPPYAMGTAQKNKKKKKTSQMPVEEFPCGSVGLGSSIVTAAPVASVQSLVWELRFHSKLLYAAGQRTKPLNKTDFIYLFISFFIFLGPHPQHMEVPRLGVESELPLPPTPQPQQHQI